MRKNIIIIALVFPLISCFAPLKVVAEEKLTAEQLISLMEASRGQYNTIASKIKAKAYQRNKDSEPNLVFTMESIIRWSPEKSFSKTTTFNYSDANQREGSLENIRSYSIKPTSTKVLFEFANGRTPQGRIEPVSDEEPQPVYGIYQAMWSASGGWNCSWENERVIEPSVTYDNEKKLYIMKFKTTSKEGGPWVIMYIDPSKNFMPIKKEIFLKSADDVNNLIIRFESSDFNQVKDGLWIPYKYSWHDPRVNFSTDFFVEEASVNEPIADTLFDFEFPEGAIVTDNRIGARYKVTKAAGQTVTSVPTEPNAVIKLPQPATDEKLRSIAGKAWQLAAAGAAEKQALKIEVFPQYVYVKPDKTQYLLTIKTNNDIKPQLLDFSFESDKMNLASLENQIYEKSRLIVNVQRQQEEKGFQKAILSLQFADEKINVVFVSPPLGNTP